jgi:hypothetical protein
VLTSCGLLIDKLCLMKESFLTFRVLLEILDSVQVTTVLTVTDVHAVVDVQKQRFHFLPVKCLKYESVVENLL